MSAFLCRHGARVGQLGLRLGIPVVYHRASVLREVCSCARASSRSSLDRLPFASLQVPISSSGVSTALILTSIVRCDGGGLRAGLKLLNRAIEQTLVARGERLLLRPPPSNGTRIACCVVTHAFTVKNNICVVPGAAIRRSEGQLFDFSKSSM